MILNIVLGVVVWFIGAFVVGLILGPILKARREEMEARQ